MKCWKCLLVCLFVSSYGPLRLERELPQLAIWHSWRVWWGKRSHIIYLRGMEFIPLSYTLRVLSTLKVNHDKIMLLKNIWQVLQLQFKRFLFTVWPGVQWAVEATIHLDCFPPGSSSWIPLLGTDRRQVTKMPSQKYQKGFFDYG